MPVYQRLLLIANGAQAPTPAFQRAAAIAQATGAALHIVAFVHARARSFGNRTRPEVQDGPDSDRLTQSRRALDLEVASLRGQGLTVTSDVLDARRPAESIQAYIREMRPDLVIKDAERSGHLRRIILRSLDWSLLRNCPAPVLLVRASPSSLPRRIVVGVDLLQRSPSCRDLTDRVIGHAQAYARQFDAELLLAYSLNLQSPRHIECVVQPVQPEPAVDDVDEADESFDRRLSERQAQIRREFEALARRHSVPEQCAQLLFGSPEQTLPTLARVEHADTLVIGSVQHDVLDRLLGRTGEYLVEKVPCDVLVVRQ